MIKDRDPETLVSHADSLSAVWTDGDRVTAERRAALTICDLAGNRDDALAPLAALGLIDPYASLPATADAGPDTRRRSGTASHGTASGLSWHRRTRVPLCRDCRAWANRNENGAR